MVHLDPSSSDEDKRSNWMNDEFDECFGPQLSRSEDNDCNAKKKLKHAIEVGENSAFPQPSIGERLAHRKRKIAPKKIDEVAKNKAKQQQKKKAKDVAGKSVHHSVTQARIEMGQFKKKEEAAEDDYILIEDDDEEPHVNEAKAGKHAASSMGKKSAAKKEGKVVKDKAFNIGKKHAAGSGGQKGGASTSGKKKACYVSDSEDESQSSEESLDHFDSEYTFDSNPEEDDEQDDIEFEIYLARKDINYFLDEMMTKIKRYVRKRLSRAYGNIKNAQMLKTEKEAFFKKK